MIDVVIRVEQAPDGSYTVMVGQHRVEGSEPTPLEYFIAKRLNQNIQEKLELLVGDAPLESIVANTGDSKVNAEIIEAARQRFSKQEPE